MPKAVAMTIGVGGVEIAINYLESNKRVTNVSWEIPTGYAGRCQIWNSGELVYDQTYGSGSGADNVPGNHTLVEVEDEFGGPSYLALPNYLTYVMHIRSVG